MLQTTPVSLRMHVGSFKVRERQYAPSIDHRFPCRSFPARGPFVARIVQRLVREQEGPALEAQVDEKAYLPLPKGHAVL